MTEEHTIEIRRSTYRLLEHGKDEDQTVQEFLEELLKQDKAIQEFSQILSE